MKQRYSFPLWLASFAATKSNSQLQNAMRLFIWLKTHGYPASFYRADIESKIPFSPEQQSDFFATLKEHGLLGSDEQGKIYLRGRRAFVPKYGREMLEVKPEATETPESWTEFLHSIPPVAG